MTLEGDVVADGGSYDFPPRAAAIVISLRRPPGEYRIAVQASTAVRVEIGTEAGRPVPVPLRPDAYGPDACCRDDRRPDGSQTDGIVSAQFSISQPLEAVRLMPVEHGRLLLHRVAVEAEPIPPSLLPAWSVGAVAVPPPSAEAPIVTGLALPTGWSGCRLLSAQAVRLDGTGATVETGGGVVELALDGASPGWWRCEADLFDAAGRGALVEPRVAAAPSSPLDGAILRPHADARYVADFRLGEAPTTVLFAPRLERGFVDVRRLAFRPLTAAERAERLFRPVRKAAATLAGRCLASAPRGPRSRIGLPEQRSTAAVTVVVATRDAPFHLSRFLSTLRATAPDAELVIVDNGTTDPAARDLLAWATRDGAIVLPDDRPFNFAALANRGAAAATGDVLVFANNDIVFTRADWLHRLLAPIDGGVAGVTGARLLYPDGRVQHGGVVLAGEARVRHAERFLPWWRGGHEGRQRRTVPVAAVTAALMATPRALFRDLGGFDAARYGVLYNDIDYCLRVRARNLPVLYVAAAEAVHAESVTIGPRQRVDPFARGGAVWRMWRTAEAASFRAEWASLLDGDPCYPPGLDPVEAAFTPLPRR